MTNLDVVVGIPIGVVDDDRVGCVQVDAETSGASWQQEGKLLGAILVETIDGVLKIEKTQNDLQMCWIFPIWHQSQSHLLNNSTTNT